MKKTMVVILLVLISVWAMAEGSRTKSLGIGIPYGGFGFTYGESTSSSYKYLSAGMNTLGIAETSEMSTLGVGLGIGYVTTSLLAKDNNKHGLGLHLAATYENGNEFESYNAFVAPYYSYYFKGIDSSGWSVGLGFPVWLKNISVGYGIQFGYQF